MMALPFVPDLRGLPRKAELELLILTRKADASAVPVFEGDGAIRGKLNCPCDRLFPTDGAAP